MAGLESDTIRGFNEMIEKQRTGDGGCVVTTVLFNHRPMILHDRRDIQELRPLSDYDYDVRGSTALLDAMGKTIKKTVSLHALMGDEKPHRVMFVVTTDGLENSSREFSYRQIKTMIDEQKQNSDWEFIFLGANIDAVGEAARLGINRSRAARYHADDKGTRMNFKSLGDAIDDFRADRRIHDHWSAKIASYAKKKQDDES